MKAFVHYGYKAMLLMLMYLIIFGMGIFMFDLPNSNNQDAFDIASLSTSSDIDLYAGIIEDNAAALNTRLALINDAQDTIDISTYSIHNDQAKSIIHYALLDAADRGVTIRYLIDGFFEGGRYTDDPGLDYLSMHDNIEVKYYNTFSLTQPKEVHNRMHDKLLIIDDSYLLMSGRNIGDRYFTGDTLYDRDVLINGEDSQVIQDSTTYFDALYHYPLSDIYHKEADDTARLTLEAAYNDYLQNHPISDTLETLEASLIPITQALFIHNPLTAIPKEPVLLESLVEIATTKDNLIIQSPYIILTQDMKRILDPLMDKDITFLTNSPASNTNVPAAGGYLRDRDAILDMGTVYEYKGAMLHAKSMVFGNDISVIGSFNMDPRSANLSTESMLVLVSEPFNQALRAHMNTLIDDSVMITESTEMMENASLARRAAITITQILFTPFKRLL